MLDWGVGGGGEGFALIDIKILPLGPRSINPPPPLLPPLLLTRSIISHFGRMRPGRDSQEGPFSLSLPLPTPPAVYALLTILDPVFVGTRIFVTRGGSLKRGARHRDDLSIGLAGGFTGPVMRGRPAPF